MASTATDTSSFAGVVPGMTIRIHQKIKDVNPKGEEKERVQIYEGMVIKRKGGSQRGATVTVRKISNGVGVEKIFPINLPAIVKVEKKKQAEVRRSKLYYLRTYKKKLKEKALA
jgi:large subunit ribosomal protein L19